MHGDVWIRADARVLSLLLCLYPSSPPLCPPRISCISHISLFTLWLLRRQLTDLAKITSRKSVANNCIFHFKTPGGAEGEVDVLAFILDDKRKCIDMVKRNYKQLVFVK